MWTRWFRRPAIVGLELERNPGRGLTGCGGQPSDSSTAVLVPEPNSLTTKTAARRRYGGACNRGRPPPPRARRRPRPSRPKAGERSRVRSSSAVIRRPGESRRTR